MATRLIRHQVEKCPRCGAAHDFALMVRDLAEISAVPLFGGPAGAGGPEVGFTCPSTNQPFVQIIPNPPGAEILGPADPSSGQAPPSAKPSSPGGDEFGDWVKLSRQVATDYCKTMLTTSTAAIPVYWAVLKYLRLEQVSSSAVALLAIVPPLLFLTATVLFALALRPRFAALRPEQFLQFRTNRLRQLDRYINAGTTAFVVGVGLAILLFLTAMYSSRA
jgi:hypothetical protein